MSRSLSFSQLFLRHISKFCHFLSLGEYCDHVPNFHWKRDDMNRIVCSSSLNVHSHCLKIPISELATVSLTGILDTCELPRSDSTSFDQERWRIPRNSGADTKFGEGRSQEAKVYFFKECPACPHHGGMQVLSFHVFLSATHAETV